MATQIERRTATQRRLLDATLGCLVERGFAGTTTTEVCRRAGVSQGALFRHFPTKADLLAAVVADLFPGLVGAFAWQIEATVDTDAPVRDRAVAAMDLLWATFEQPDLLAAAEIYVAARTDPDLARALREVEPAHRRRLHDLAAAIFPELADRPLFGGIVDTVVDAVQGAALGRLAIGERPGDDAMRAALVEIMTTFAETDER